MTETKRITVKDNWGEIKMKIIVPVDIWFNAAYGLRGKLHDAKEMTISQFLLTSDETLHRVLSCMNKRALNKFSSLLRQVDSKRGNRAEEIVAEVSRGT